MSKESNIILVTGGARSGKSNFSEKIAIERYENISYIATARPSDEGMKDRIKKHIESRPKTWKTYEIYDEISKKIPDIAGSCDCILLDCITVMITNLILKDNLDWDNISREEIDSLENKVSEEIDKLMMTMFESGLNGIIVTNEIGSGIVPENRLARIFRDIAGRANQKLAAYCNEVYYVVSGISIKIK